MSVKKIIAEKKGTMLDVRSPSEFREGNANGSINIPLQDLRQRIEEVKNMKLPIIACCASGNRSGQASTILTQLGIECINGGSWTDIKYYQSKSN